MLAKYAFPAKEKVIIEIEERENSCKMICIAYIYLILS